MKHIGNIITDGKIDDSLYNIVKNYSDIDSNLPSLFIGLQKAKDNIDNFSIIEWKRDQMTYWTFGKRENRSRFEIDFEKFKKITVSHLIKTFNYKFENFFLMDVEEKQALMSLISNSDSKVAYIVDSFVYLYSQTDNTTHGILLSDIEYEGLKTSNLKNMILNNDNINVIYSNNVNYSIKQLFSNNKYIIPYLYS